MARALYEFPPDIGFRPAARQAILAGFEKMMHHFAATRAGLEVEQPTPEGIEALHDMRVGSRRLRAALSVFAKVLPADDFKTVERQVTEVTDGLGSVRDLDVQVDHLSALLPTIPANEAYGIERMIVRLTRQRNKRRKKLLALLVVLEREKFERRFLKVVERALPGDPPTEETGG